MCISTDQIQTIRQAATDAFGQGTAVWMFESPVDDARQGGDIDLLVSADAFPKQKQVTLKVTA